MKKESKQPDKISVEKIKENYIKVKNAFHDVKLAADNFTEVRMRASNLCTEISEELDMYFSGGTIMLSDGCDILTNISEFSTQIADMYADQSFATSLKKHQEKKNAKPSVSESTEQE